MLSTRYAACFFAVIAIFTPFAFAVEPAESFLQGLRDRGLHDEAYLYLQQMESSPLASEAFRKRIPFEKGITRLEQSKQIGDAKARAAMIAEAEKLVESLVASDPNGESARALRMELAGTLASHGRTLRVHAENLPEANASDRENEMRDARAALERARTAYEASKKDYREILDALPKTINANTDAALYEKRHETGRTWLSAWSLGLLAKFDEALTYPDGDKTRKKLMTETAKDLANLKDKYYQHFVGQNALLYEGRCYLDLGKTKEAIACFEEIVEQQADAPEMRQLAAKAVRYQAECYLRQQKHIDAIRRCEEWLGEARGAEEKASDWLAVRYQLALAHAGAMEKATEDKEKRDHRRAARKEFQFIARQRDAFAAESRRQAAALAPDGDANAIELAGSFDEAFLNAKDALEQLSLARGALDAARDNAPDRVGDFETAIQESQREAVRLLQHALALGGKETATDSESDADTRRNRLDALNQARAYLCYAYYMGGEYWKSAVIGEFLARRYPEHAMAKNAAKLAMLSYQQLYAAAREEGRPLESLGVEGTKMGEVAVLITRAWPNTSDAAEAFSGLIDFAVRENRVEDAVKYLEEVPESQRAAANLKVGAALWARSAQDDKNEEADATSPDANRQKAIALLEDGFAKLQDTSPTPTIAVAGLFLAQAMNEKSEHDRAIEVLEREKIGPLALVASRNPAADRDGYAASVYRTALQAYVLSTPPRNDEAEKLMDALEASLKGDDAAETTLLQIYLGLGVRIQRQLERMKDDGNAERRERVAEAFEKLLNQIGDRLEGADWKSRAWLARAYFELGESVDSGDSLTPDAKAYYEKSLQAYEKLLSAAASDGAAPSEALRMVALKQQADSYRRLRQFERAIEGYAAILEKKPMMLDVQQTAAKTYEEWGGVDPTRYENAIAGGAPGKNGENVIFGWAKIARLAGRVAKKQPEYKSLYFDGWLEVAKVRLAAAKKEQGDARSRELQRAKQSIRTIHQLYPDLGGEASRNAYDSVIKEIQKALQQPTQGLAEFG